MKKWLLSCCNDSIGVHHDVIIESPFEPDFITCYRISTALGAAWFTLNPISE